MQVGAVVEAIVFAVALKGAILRRYQHAFVDVDIKPRSCPNPINTSSKGDLPVAILGSDDFDGAKIDSATVQFEGVAPHRWSIKDVAAPYAGDMEVCDTYACTDSFRK